MRKILIGINPNKETPIYTQLIYEIKKNILSGELKKGEMMPSVRTLAGDIGINMHTVNKVYKLLTEQGVLIQKKKGFAVSSDEVKDLEDKQLKNFKEKLEELVIDSKIFNLSKEKIEEMIKDIEKKLNIDL